jgi:hypothetical protein
MRDKDVFLKRIRGEFSPKEWKILMSKTEFANAVERADARSEIESLIVLGEQLLDKKRKPPGGGQSNGNSVR